MLDVARLARVSLKTVSRVVNGEGGVADDTSDRVRRAAAELRYLPNAAASSLARSARRTRSIALLIGTMDNPFYAGILRGVEEAAQDRAVVVFAASTRMSLETEESLVRAFASRQVDGFLIAPAPGDHAVMVELMGPSVPCVYVDCAPMGATGDVVTADNVPASAAATRHLIAHGHRRIGFLCDDLGLSTAAGRLAGYRGALREAGLAYDPALVTTDVVTTADAEAAVERLLDRTDPPTALFASRNMASIGAIRVLKRRGLSHRVALVGMDELDVADLVDPPLTTMAQDPVAFGHLAAERLFERIDGHDMPPETLIVPAQLVVRGSGEIAAPDHPASGPR